KRIAPYGTAFACVSQVAVAFVAGWQSVLVVELLTVAIGFGSGTTFPVGTVSVQNADDHAQLGVATGVLTFLRSLGAALGVATLGAVALGYGLPLAGEGHNGAAVAIDSAAPFTAIFFVAAAMLAASFVMLALMPEKPLR